MSQESVVVGLAAPVVEGGLFIVDYPDGRVAASFTIGGHHIFPRALQALFSSDDGGITVTFGAPNIEVVYHGDTTIPANSFVSCDFALAGPGDDDDDGHVDWLMATQAEALAGVSNTVVMSPLRVDQAITANNQELPAILGPYIDFIAKAAIDNEVLPGESIDNAIDAAIAAIPSSTANLYFFDKAGDLALVTIPAGVDTIYRLGYLKRGDHELTRFKRKALLPTTAPINNLAWERDAAGVYFVNDMPRLDCRTMGAFADGQQLNGSGTTNTMTAGSNRVTLPGANFTSADVGKLTQVNGAGPLLENATGDLVFTDWLTGKIGAVVSATEFDLVDINGSPLLATQTVTAVEAKTVFWVTDYTVALKNGQRAAATMGKFLYVPGGPNYVGSTASLCGINGYSNIRLEGDGPTSRILSFAAQVAGDGAMFYIVGAMVPRGNLAAPAAAGQDTIQVVSATGLTVDSYIALRDKSQSIYDLSQEEPFGIFLGYRSETVRIREITGTTIKLHAMLEESYAASAVAGQESDVQSLNFVDDLTIRNITLDMSKPIATTNTQVINAVRTRRLTVENVFFPHCVYGVAVSYSIDWAIRNNRFEWGGIVDGTEADGDHDRNKAYAVTVGGCNQAGVVFGNSARNVRHFLTAFSGGGMVPKHVRVDSNIVTEARVCIDTHPGADYWTVIGNNLNGGIWMDDVAQYGYGLQVRGHHNEILNNSISNVAIALQIAFVEDTRAIGNRINFCDVGVSLYNCRDTELSDTKINSCRVMALYWHFSTSNSNPPQRWGYCKIKGFRLSGNPTSTSLVEDYPSELPCGMQFGYWNTTTHTFQSQWVPGITIEDWEMPDCLVPFQGADHEAVYGAGILDVATAQNMRVEEVASAGIAALTSGTLFLSEIDLKIGRRITQVGLPFATAGAGQTALWFGLFDKDRNCLSLTNDLGAVAPSTTAVTFGTLARTHVTTQAGRHYIGVCQVAATPSQVYGKSLASVFASLTPRKAGNSNAALTGPASYPKISSATSTTLLTASLQYPVKKLTTQAGKAFVPSMRVRIALTADPTKYFDGVVTTYASTTLCVDCETEVGLAALAPATLNAWTITADAVATAITGTGNMAFVVTA